MTAPATDAAILAVLRRAGLWNISADPAMKPLTGGVSSDIWRVDLPDGAVAVKRALRQLRVQKDWQAPVERNGFEAAWMEEARRHAPSAVPKLLHQDVIAGALVMNFLDPQDHPLWKAMLMEGWVVMDHAWAVGLALAAVHAGTAGRTEVAETFPTDRIFHDIRLEPYLLATAELHPDLGRQLRGLARSTAATKIALVHGDVSPKNILIGPRGPVFLDAECAWFGDPAFDLAFCLNHLLLKCLWRRPSAEAYLSAFDALAEAYLAEVVWERRDRLEERTAALLPGLLLARVDGKSPVEYLHAPDDQDKVRKVARHFLAHVPDRLAAIREAWALETVI
ncbi:MAG TPA: aminoglycoside phosphotransferase family protein [Geminicoccus sp.]|uniref:phosphotransferase family protein n=1 Tax=Geminicoccus sp. TaxID=2024832 RepID=UPI002E306F8D|nr:aminoglycoside phosphotransferase family protein [Geminicoccus sp.]HEX2529100.1 aminoglycoside phosphotransferase family protein [Geminicoccus sp.]